MVKDLHGEEREEVLRRHLLINMQSDKAIADATGSAENIDPAISSLSHAIMSQTQLAPVAPMAPVESSLSFQRDNGTVDSSNHSENESAPRCIPDASDIPKRSGKRELSTSKRAAQNRAAQRAFRQRKEGYIKKLEEQVRDFGVMEEQFKAIQAENYSLRAYIISLQSRLIESQGEDAVPPPPSHLSGAQRVQIIPNARTPEQVLTVEPVTVLPVDSSVVRSEEAQTDVEGLTTLRETQKSGIHHEDEEYNAFLAKRLKTDNDVSKLSSA